MSPHWVPFGRPIHDSSIVDATEQGTKHSASKMTSSNQGREQFGHFLGTSPGIDFLNLKWYIKS